MERMELSILPIHHPRIPSEFRASDSEGCSNRVSSISRTRRWPIKQGIYRRDEWLYMDGLMEMSNLGLTIRDGRGGRQTEASINPRRQVSLLPWLSKGPINKKRNRYLCGSGARIILKLSIKRVSPMKNVYAKDKKKGDRSRRRWSMQQRFHVQKERKLPLLSDKRGRERERGKGGFARSALLFSLLSFSVPGVVAAFAIFVSYPRSIYKCQAFACTCSTLYDLCIPIVRERESCGGDL